jgi:peptidoglycan DL-endopeptidase CwlO
VIVGQGPAAEPSVHVRTTGQTPSTPEPAPAPRVPGLDWPCPQTQPALHGEADPDLQQQFNHFTLPEFSTVIGYCTWGYSIDEIRCMHGTVEGESHWNARAGNPRYSYGVPQSNPGDKMAMYGDDWLTNGRTQLRWMWRYVDDNYDGPYDLPHPCHAGY